MKFKHLCLIAGTIALSFIGISIQVNASSLNGRSYASEAVYKVATAKKVKVFRVKTGAYEAANRIVSTKYLKKGTVLYKSTWLMSTNGWIVDSSHTPASRHYFYLVPTGSGHWWKKAPTKKKTKSANESWPVKNLSYPHAPATLKECVNNYVFSDYLTDEDLTLDLAETKEKLEDNENAIVIKIPGVQLQLNSIDNTYALVTYQGKQYYTEADDVLTSLVPFNTVKSGNYVYSSVLPNNKSEVKLKYGQTIKSSYTWDYTNPKTNKQTLYVYVPVTHKWSKM